MIQSTNDTADEDVTRITQYGIRLPDGSVAWAIAGKRDDRGNPEPQTLKTGGSGGRTYRLEPKYDGNRHTLSFADLDQDHQKMQREAHVNPAPLVRIVREVVIVYGVATDHIEGENRV